jgi:hypothetical protein
MCESTMTSASVPREAVHDRKNEDQQEHAERRRQRRNERHDGLPPAEEIPPADDMLIDRRPEDERTEAQREEPGDPNRQDSPRRG